MSSFKTSLNWRRETSDFKYDTYDRTHQIRFPGGTTIQASSAPDYKGKAEFVNPEEGILAALSSCHMLTFLAVACKSGFVVDSYSDEASAVLGKMQSGKLGVVTAVLRPAVQFSGEKQPNKEELAKLHDKAHQNCFIANTIQTEVTIESRSL